MKVTVELTPDARDDIQSIAEYYLSVAGATVASGILSLINEALESLVTQAQRGHIPHELYESRTDDILEIIVQRYRIIYRLNSHIASVIAVMDGRQDVKSHLLKRRLRLK